MSNISEFMSRAKREKELKEANAALAAAEAKRVSARASLLTAMGWTDVQAEAVLEFISAELELTINTGMREYAAEALERSVDYPGGLQDALEGQ